MGSTFQFNVFTGTFGIITTPDHHQTDRITAMVGQTVFSLGATPADTSDVRMSINGQEQDQGAGDYTASSTQVIFVPATAGFTLNAGDDVQIDYDTD